MGPCLSSSAQTDVGLEEEDEKKNDPKRKDNRKRNSQMFSLVDFIDATQNRPIPPGDEELGPMDFSLIRCENNAAKRMRELFSVKQDPRAARANLTADSVACGNMRTMREQVISHFTTINRPYTGHWEGDTLLHIICREG